MISDLSDIRPVADYLRRIGAAVRGMRSAHIQEQEGRYKREIAVIRLADDGQITVSSPTGEDVTPFLPKEHERAAIADAMQAAKFPELNACITIRNAPEMVRTADPDAVFELRNEQGEIVMLQVRIEKQGDKSYIPFTYWTDNKWRMIEPDGELPLWGIDQLKDNFIVFVHEGAKAARAVRHMVEAKTPDAKAALAAHPWGEELRYAAHIGWIGGALSPHRTDWKILQKLGVTHVYIVADNDGPGHDAVPKIARALAAYPITVEAVRFTEESWPVGFDLADPFPDKLFKKVGDGPMRYVGPSMRDCTLPATWATRAGQAPQPTGRRGTPVSAPMILRQEFAALWVLVVTPSGTMFAPRDNPTLLFNPHQFETISRVFSHVRRLADLFEAQAYKSIVHGIAYEPGRAPGIINIDGVRSLNTYMPPRIKRWKDTSGMWEQFLAHLFPDPEDRHQFCRWLATLIALPHLRMRYGVLLVSVMQGVGKSTLFDIVCVLVGLHNCSTPSASLIVNSDFNGWLARKRVVVVHEIYEGGSWKAYNRLKSVITDDTLLVNEKFQATYTVRNQAHFMLGSNSERALLIEQTDRRWLVPGVTEEKHPKNDPGFWLRFHAWLASGGHGAIAQWADDFVTVKGHAVGPGETAPSTRRKDQLIEDSRSPQERAALDLAELARAQRRPVVLLEQDVLAWIHAAAGERRPGHEIPAHVVRSWLAAAGLHVCKHENRPKVDGRKTYIASTVPLTGDSPLAGRDWRTLKEYRVLPKDLEVM